MTGFDENFLGIRTPLPGFLPSLEMDVLRNDRLDGEIYAHYPHYTIVTSRTLRSPVYAALNIDQRLLKTVSRTDRWRVDGRIGAEFQLGEEYYYDNPWDRGHLARRATAAWGTSVSLARKASDETFYYSNASLQLNMYNQDEWLGLEEWVRTLKDDDNDKVNVICGPIYQRVNYYVRPEGVAPAPVPSAFFKVVLFRHRDAPDTLSVRAFILPQDREAMRDRKGWKLQNLQTYQVSIRQIEMLTGLDFSPEIAEANPMFFTESDATRRLGVTILPEAHEVNAARDIIDPGQPRVPVRDGEIPVSILAALVNPAGDERQEEWVSVGNMGTTNIDLDGWTLEDTHGRACALSGRIGPGEAMRVQPIAAMQLANAKPGVITLFNGNRERVARVRYFAEESRIEGRPIVFADPDRIATLPSVPDTADPDPLARPT